MSFLLVVLTIRFLVERAVYKKKYTNANDKDVRTGTILHPAEFALR
jgi:hypothetical protein